ncbi:MOSC N-terminal beta barrel domain-containing protein [Streptomyces sp. NPDC048664]|uniref:MOSC domain-containing protein n=1 Tax=Streptomyces sp. NPDC048664 TaxID=3154505 RepID=UPI00343F1C8F
MPHVAKLTCFPVKGAAGTHLDEAVLTPAGLAHDRSFMVTGADGVFRTQRRDPRLALVHPAVSPGGELLTLRADGLPPLDVPVDTRGPRVPVDLFGQPFHGIDQGEEAARWLSGILRAPSRLVRVPPEHDRITDGRTPGTSGYADSCALHVLSRATLDLLDEKLAENGAPAVPADRFRANVVIDGWDEPHTEDRAHRLTVAGTDLGYAKPAIRCAVVMVDQRRGRRDGPEPLRTLAGYRRAAGGGVALGVKYAVLRPGRIRVGDEVTVTAWGESEV